MTWRSLFLDRISQLPAGKHLRYFLHRCWISLKYRGNEQESRVRFIRWEYAKAVGRPIVDHLREFGIELILYPDDILCELIYGKTFELSEQQLLWSYLKEGDIFVDVGANIGLFTLIAARRVGERGRVYAFEPTTLTYDRLQSNIEINHLRNVVCLKLALSDQIESRDLFTSVDGFAAWNSFGYPPRGNVYERESVQCISWDEFVTSRQLQGKIALLKLDIEGWELYALNGAELTLSRSDAPDLLVEFTDKNAQAVGISCQALYEKLEHLGYRVYRFDTSRRVISPDPVRETYSYSNLLATKQITTVCARTGFVLDEG